MKPKIMIKVPELQEKLSPKEAARYMFDSRAARITAEELRQATETTTTIVKASLNQNNLNLYFKDIKRPLAHDDHFAARGIVIDMYMHRYYQCGYADLMYKNSLYGLQPTSEPKTVNYIVDGYLNFTYFGFVLKIDVIDLAGPERKLSSFDWHLGNNDSIRRLARSWKDQVDLIMRVQNSLELTENDFLDLADACGDEVELRRLKRYYLHMSQTSVFEQEKRQDIMNRFTALPPFAVKATNFFGLKLSHLTANPGKYSRLILEPNGSCNYIVTEDDNILRASRTGISVPTGLEDSVLSLYSRGPVFYQPKTCSAMRAMYNIKKDPEKASNAQKQNETLAPVTTLAEPKQTDSAVQNGKVQNTTIMAKLSARLRYVQNLFVGVSDVPTTVTANILTGFTNTSSVSSNRDVLQEQQDIEAPLLGDKSEERKLVML